MKKKIFWMIPVSIFTLALLTHLVINFSPEKNIFVYGYPLNPIILLLTGIFFFVSLAASFFLKNTRRGIFLAAFVIGLLLLSFYNLTQPIFIILLLGLVGTLELFFTFRN